MILLIQPVKTCLCTILDILFIYSFFYPLIIFFPYCYDQASQLVSCVLVSVQFVVIWGSARYNPKIAEMLGAYRGRGELLALFRLTCVVRTLEL